MQRTNDKHEKGKNTNFLFLSLLLYLLSFPPFFSFTTLFQFLLPSVPPLSHSNLHFFQIFHHKSFLIFTILLKSGALCFTRMYVAYFFYLSLHITYIYIYENINININKPYIFMIFKI